MKGKDKNIFPRAELFLSRKDKEKFLDQQAKAIWFTGFSGSGKTSIAAALEKKLMQEGFLTKIFDGDIVRDTINKDLDFSGQGRMQNIKKIAEINREFINCGIITINSFVSPTSEMRAAAREIIGADDFIEVFVKCPLSVCESRDYKGLYAKARQGMIKNFTGIDSHYEIPENPDIIIDNETGTIDQAVNTIYQYMLPKIKLSK